ncbi:MAG: ArsR/SmtB family transcription factor, partial [Streptomyces sp.]
LRRDLGRLDASRDRLRPLSADVRTLADGDTAALRRLRTALCGYHRHALAPFWPQIRAQVEADRAIRTRAVLEGGIDGLLASFRPVLRWEPPVLEADYPVHRVVPLEGRGLLLQPSFFCTRRPVTLADPDMTPTLVYPIQHPLGWVTSRGGTPARGAGLAALIGQTRAAVLEDVTGGRTTGELAERLGISAQDASYHTAVLRRAGLLLSVRRSRNMLHTITPAGLTLLESPPGTPVDA